MPWGWKLGAWKHIHLTGSQSWLTLPRAKDQRVNLYWCGQMSTVSEIFITFLSTKFLDSKLSRGKTTSSCPLLLMLTIVAMGKPWGWGYNSGCLIMFETKLTGVNKKALVNNWENQRKVLKNPHRLSPGVKSNLTSLWLRPEKRADRLTDLLTDWLTYWLTDWPTERLTDWLTDWRTDGLTNWPTDWLRDEPFVLDTKKWWCILVSWFSLSFSSVSSTKIIVFFIQHHCNQIFLGPNTSKAR